MIDFIFKISFFKYLLSIPVSVYGVSYLIVKLKPKNSTITAQKRSVIAKGVFCGMVFILNYLLYYNVIRMRLFILF